MRKRVYIAGPISRGDLAANINRATDAFNELMAAGLAPFCPHWSCFAGGLSRERWVTAPDGHQMWVRSGDPVAVASSCPTKATHADWIEVCLTWVGVSDAVLRLPGESSGADQEVAFARECRVPVFDSVEAVVAWDAARR